MENLQTYHTTVVTMEKAGVDPEYVLGWQGGFLHNPKREEQRCNEAYDAGFDDGSAAKTDGYKTWVKK